MVDGDASCSDVVPSGRNSGDNGTSTQWWCSVRPLILTCVTTSGGAATIGDVGSKGTRWWGGGGTGSGSIGEEVVLGVVLLAMVFSITSTGVSSCSSSAG